MRSLDDPSHDAVTSVCVRLIIDASPVVGGILGDLRPFLDICSQTQSHWVSPQISMLVPNAGLATEICNSSEPGWPISRLSVLSGRKHS